MPKVSEIGLIGAKAEGKCCWKIYQKSFFKGFGQTVRPGILVVFGQSKLNTVRSLKKNQLLTKFNKSKFNKVKSQSLKITEKVSFNIAIETSYVYILRGQKVN